MIGIGAVRRCGRNAVCGDLVCDIVDGVKNGLGYTIHMEEDVLENVG